MKSRERIINAAIPIFARKGRHGAHMEEIAANAHINKAMIYYIFHSKDELYFEVLKFVLEQAEISYSSFFGIDKMENLNYSDILSRFIESQIRFFSEFRDYTKIMVDAMSSGGESVILEINKLKEKPDSIDGTAVLRDIIEKGKAENVIRNVDTNQLMISIVGMIIVYFFSRSLTESLDIEVEDENKFLEERKESIIDLVLNGILTVKSGEEKKADTVQRKRRAL